MISGGGGGRGELVVEHQACDQVTVRSTLQAPLSGTFLQTLPDLVNVTEGALFISAQLSTDAVLSLIHI